MSFSQRASFITDEIIKDDNRTMLLRLDTATSYGVGIEWTTKKGNLFTATLNYLDMGDAPVESPDLPVIGVISGQYTKRDGRAAAPSSNAYATW